MSLTKDDLNQIESFMNRVVDTKLQPIYQMLDTIEYKLTKIDERVTKNEEAIKKI